MTKLKITSDIQASLASFGFVVTEKPKSQNIVTVTTSNKPYHNFEIDSTETIRRPHLTCSTVI